MFSKKYLTFALFALLALGGCEKKKDGAKDDGKKSGESSKKAENEKGGDEKDETAEKKNKEAAESDGKFPGFSRDKEMKALAGTWKVKVKFQADTPFTWKIDGDDVVQTGGEEGKKNLKLSIPYPGRLAVKDGNTRKYYSYARDAESGKVWIGLGEGGMKLDGNYYIGGDNGVVQFDGDKCVYHPDEQKFGPDPKWGEPKEIECSVKEEGDGKVFMYQMPKFGKDDEWEDEKVTIVGTALLNDQLKSEHLAKPVEGGSEK